MVALGYRPILYLRVSGGEYKDAAERCVFLSARMPDGKDIDLALITTSDEGKTVVQGRNISSEYSDYFETENNRIFIDIDF